MNIDIAKSDLLTLRDFLFEEFQRLKRTPANKDPSFHATIRPQMRVAAKVICKLNRAYVKAYGHECHPPSLEIEPWSATRSKP